MAGVQPPMAEVQEPREMAFVALTIGVWLPVFVV
jgi:hypothetical protein